MVSIIIGYKTEFIVYHSKHKIQPYQFHLSIMLGNRQHMFLIPDRIQVTPHYTCLDSLYVIAPNHIYDFSTVNENKKQQFPKEIYGKKSKPTCVPRFKTTYGSLDFISRTAKSVPLITFTFNIPMNSTIPSCCHHEYQSLPNEITNESSCSAITTDTVVLDNKTCFMSSILNYFSQ